MRERTSPLLRGVRASILAGVAMLCGTLAHVSAGGRTPAAAWLVVLLAILGWLSARFLAHPASVARVITLVVAGQTCVHMALTALAGHHGDGVGGARPSPPVPAVQIPDDVWTRTERVGSLSDQLMVGRPASASPTLSVPDWALHLWADLQPEHLPMLLAHLAAGAAVGWWLATGERALWAVVTLTAAPLVNIVRGLQPQPVPSQRSIGAALTSTTPRPGRAALHSTLQRRGPPEHLRAC